MNNRWGTRKWLFYTFIGTLADTLDTILAFVAPEKTPERIRSSDIDEPGDEEILALRRTALRLHSDYNVYKLTLTTVVKSSQDMEDGAIDATEANALQLVFTKTTIPVPRVRRVVKREWEFLIVMDYIKGRTLAQVWPTFSVRRKFFVAFTLRRYIRQLRHLSAPPTTPPGPLSAQGPRICESPVFGQVQSSRGPSSSYSELSTFFNERCKMVLDAKGVPEDHPSRKKKFDDSGPLVLMHQDLNLRNVIPGDDGRLWIIDWRWSGYCGAHDVANPNTTVSIPGFGTFLDRFDM
ncbi:hypothetical protein EDD17DRAFT_1770646 [Pisolithus thermaeus]|nr:hypothetical protein EDD17DRAFT_1770646 [Pisolithus thermaeus]